MVINVADALAAYRQNSGSAATQTGASSETEGVGSFGDMLKNFAGDAVQTLEQGEKAAVAGATGKADLTTVVTAISNAEQMLQTVTAIRDKVIAAYSDITKTAI